MNEKHGQYKNGKMSPTYLTWASMKARCDNPHTSNYKLYGGRGIKYDPRWQWFTNFLADMGERPDGMTLDRIDSGGHYNVINCRWATRTEQVRNRRNNINITLLGETRCLAEWCSILGLNYKTINARIAYGWSPRKALTTPISRDRGHL